MLEIVGVFVAAAILFGLVHDQVTARVCVEYFTVAHERIVDSESPTVLGLVWGVVATWWAGALAGLVVSLAAREGPWPRLGWRHFVRPAAWLVIAMACSASMAGIAGFFLTQHGIIRIVPDFAEAIAAPRHARFMADVFAHLASYGIGLGGSVVIAVRALVVRSRMGAL